LEGGKNIISRSEDYYDPALLQMLQSAPQKLGKFLQQFYAKTKTQVGDVYLVWRLKKMAEQNKLVIEGDWSKGWKDITLASANYQQSELYTTEV
jgi:hypothetical protein